MLSFGRYSDPVQAPGVTTEQSFDWKRWESAVDYETPVMAGHSLGGTAAVRAHFADPESNSTNVVQ